VRRPRPGAGVGAMTNDTSIGGSSMGRLAVVLAVVAAVGVGGCVMAFADGESVRVVGEAFRCGAGRGGRLKYGVRGVEHLGR
jgi:hypothetical protein